MKSPLVLDGGQEEEPKEFFALNLWACFSHAPCNLSTQVFDMRVYGPYKSPRKCFCDLDLNCPSSGSSLMLNTLSTYVQSFCLLPMNSSGF